MGKAEIKAAVDQHVFAMNGERHRLKFQSAVAEPRWTARDKWYLLAIDVLSERSESLTTVHIVTSAAATLDHLLMLIDGAIDEQLRRARLEAGGSIDEPCGALIA